jgi:hypothetical protein
MPRVEKTRVKPDIILPGGGGLYKYIYYEEIIVFASGFLGNWDYGPAGGK